MGRLITVWLFEIQVCRLRKKYDKRRYVIASEARQSHNSLNRWEIATARCASQ
jgi:hypothetical protein